MYRRPCWDWELYWRSVRLSALRYSNMFNWNWCMRWQSKYTDFRYLLLICSKPILRHFFSLHGSKLQSCLLQSEK